MPSLRAAATRSSTRARLLLGVVAVVVVAGLIMAGSLLRQGPVAGDVAWTAEATELGLDPSQTIDVNQASGDLIAIGSAVIDDEGRTVHTDLPVDYAAALRGDGSGWGFSGSVDDLRFAGWDAEGDTTFEFDASRDLAALLTTLDSPAPSDARAFRVQATGEDVVVLGSCWHDTLTQYASGNVSISLALDTRTGELLWHTPLLEAQCVYAGSHYQRGDVVVDPIFSSGAPQAVRDLHTGETLWQVRGDQIMTVVGGGVYQRSGEGLDRVDPRTGEIIWSMQACETPSDPSAVGDDPGLLEVRCDGRRLAIDARTGTHRDLPVEGDDGDDEERWTLGSVLVGRVGSTLTALDPLSGEELWSTQVQLAEGEVVEVRSYGGARATVAVSMSNGEAEDRAVVFDAFTGEQLLETNSDGAWQLRTGYDGATLLIHTEVVPSDADRADLYAVSGRGR